MLPSEFVTFVETMNHSPEGGLFIHDIDIHNDVFHREELGRPPAFHVGACSVVVRAKRRKPPYDFVNIEVKADTLLGACRRVMRLLEVAAE